MNFKKWAFFWLFFLVSLHFAQAQTIKRAGVFPENKAMLTQAEKTMLEEVNTCRTDPKRYSLLLADYLKELEKGTPTPKTRNISISTTIKNGVKVTRRDTTWTGGGLDKKMIDKDYQAAGRECVAQLQKTKPLTALKNIECLYNAAKTQGQYCKKVNKLGHTGANGKGPEYRLPNACGVMPNGSENLGGGAATIRIALFNLLVDARVSDRGHRKNILNPDAVYIGVYAIGIVNSMDNCFIQTFGW